MATNHDSAFPALCNIGDDSVFVHQAMDDLGFSCEFSDLPLADMQLALALALHLKRTQARAETWES
jgi:hypothetical protein